MSSVLFLSLLAFAPALVQAADLSISPASGSFTVGQNFSMSVYVAAPSETINAISGVVTFPSNKVEAVSISKSGSIISLWVQEPIFSNSSGTFNFEGIVLNPGFSGNKGKIMTVTFRAKSSGTASVVFSSGSVLSNDGLGTNVLRNMTGASYVLTTSAETPETPEPPVTSTIYSTTHPDSTKWYANANPKFNWTLPSGASGVRLLYSRGASSSPNVLYEPAVAEKQLDNIGEGKWYFHMQARTSSGWGEVSHFAFQIDTEKPEYLRIQEIKRSDLTDPQAEFSLESSDETSGIDHYEVQIDGQEVKNIEPAGNYKTQAMDPGKHTISVKAVDEAGNFLAESAEFEVAAIDAPVVTDYSEKIMENDPFIVQGTSYPQSTVRIFLQLKGSEKISSKEVTADEKGNFTVIWQDRIRKGSYEFWLEAIDQRGAKSNPTSRYSSIVSAQSIFEFGQLNLSCPSVLIGLGILILCILVLLAYLCRRFIMRRRKIKKEAKKIEENFRKSFEILREKIEKEIAKLDGKPGLTAKEKKISDSLKEALKATEKAVIKEVKDIEDLTDK